MKREEEIEDTRRTVDEAIMLVLDVSESMAKDAPDGKSRMAHAAMAADLFVQQKVVNERAFALPELCSARLPQTSV